LLAFWVYEPAHEGNVLNPLWFISAGAVLLYLLTRGDDSAGPTWSELARAFPDTPARPLTSFWFQTVSVGGQYLHNCVRLDLCEQDLKISLVWPFRLLTGGSIVIPFTSIHLEEIRPRIPPFRRVHLVLDGIPAVTISRHTAQKLVNASHGKLQLD